MSVKPTLMIKGKLQAPNGDPEFKKELDNWVPVDYVIDWFKQRRQKTGIANRVLILKSETASGKSTLFPAELYKAMVHGYDGTVPGIICTQPRTLTAIENVNEMVKQESNRKYLHLGQTIGWSTKYNKLKPTKVGLLSATVGTLTQQLKVMTDDDIMKSYGYILIDETHERDISTDLSIYMLKNLLMRCESNPACPFVVLMSATFEPQSFLDYFGLTLDNYIYCKGEAAGFDEMWDWNDGLCVTDYPAAAANIVEKIIEENPDDDPSKGDILIFMPGKKEFKLTLKHLTALNIKLATDDKKIFSPLSIDGDSARTQNLDYIRTMSIPVDQHVITIKGKNYTPHRRVVISTNVAETGLTLSNLKYVIDAGFNREVEYHPNHNINGLITKPAPLSRSKQRMGRAGRKFRGVFYPLYPKSIYDKLQKIQFPQILTSDVSDAFLSIVVEQLKAKRKSGDTVEFRISDIDMLDPPTPDALSVCLEKFYTLGFLSPTAPKWDPDVDTLMDAPIIIAKSQNRVTEKLFTDYNYSITKLGALAYMFSMIKIESVRMILSSYYWGCSILDIITIAAYISIPTKSYNWSDPEIKGKREEIPIDWTAVYKKGMPNSFPTHGILHKIRLLIADDFIHGVLLFNAIKKVIAENPDIKAFAGGLRRWCESCYINYETCLIMLKAREEIIEQMLTVSFNVFNQEDNSLGKSTPETFMDIITRLKYCIYDGYRNNILIREADGSYCTQSGISVQTPDLFAVTERTSAMSFMQGVDVPQPERMLYYGLNLQDNREATGMYSVTSDRVSTMDGFISVDLDFAI